MSTTEILITILMMSVGTAAVRFIPFLCFPSSKETPGYILFLGRFLPYSTIGLLVVYCLKGVSVTQAPFALPEIIAIVCITALHLWKRNTILSIGAGTMIYMILIQFVFA
jgi:branched-subunit amino acid transport protein AzlD